MAKYVDVEPFLAWLEELRKECDNSYPDYQTLMIYEIEDGIDALDPIVCCKDCTFCSYNSSNDTYKCRSMRGMYRAVDPNEFCSWGERK